jgi:hypothetical protein
MTRMPDIALTDEELRLLRQIQFDWSNHDDLRVSIKPMTALAESLLKRRAVPEVRLLYFTDPDRNPSGRGKSREGIFEKNGTSGDDILAHPHFLRYLEYFVFGPKLPPAVIAKFKEAASVSGHLSGSDVYELIVEAKAVVRSARLDPREAGDEFFKLALECGAIPSSAAMIRRSIRSVKSSRR